MVTNFTMVKEFHKTYNCARPDKPTFPDSELMDLRYNLISEELDELVQANINGDLVEIADALTDLLYVVYGAGVAFGIDLDKCFEEVHRSNMSKLGKDGKPIYREDGKVLKGANYFRPDLQKILNL